MVFYFCIAKINLNKIVKKARVLLGVDLVF